MPWSFIASTIEDVVAAIRRWPQGVKLLLAKDFNVDLTKLYGSAHMEDIAAAFVTNRLEDMSAHFLPRRKYWLRDGRTWSM